MAQAAFTPILFPREDLDFAETLSKIAFCNPFIPERIELEQRALGSEYCTTGKSWNVFHMEPTQDPNVMALSARAKSIASGIIEKFDKMDLTKIHPLELQLYFKMIMIMLYYQYYREPLGDIIHEAHDRGTCKTKVVFFEEYKERILHYLGPLAGPFQQTFTFEHIFAYGFQLRRAYFYIYRFIVGTSGAATRLRARVWQSIFSHDQARYLRSLHNRMSDIITLITGPSGTGKELVARAIALTRYIPFNPKTGCFEEDYLSSFYPLNLSAISPTLIESELFGHRKGAFTGALADRSGYLQDAGPWGTVFLDEIGDVSPEIQVKLLRLLQTRVYQRLGDTESLHFKGKFIAATNKDLVEEIHHERFRTDLFYRLCADQITTPSLKDIISTDEQELPFLLKYIAEQVAGPEEAESLSLEVYAWIKKNLAPDYPWSGNFRELEQCLKNILVHREYCPQKLYAKSFIAEVESGQMSMDNLLKGYVTRVYARLDNYEKTARLLEIDSRTVKKYLDKDLLAEIASPEQNNDPLET